MGTKKILVAIMVLGGVGIAANVHALKAPHASPTISSCGDCHSTADKGYKSITSFTSLCFNSKGCHDRNHAFSSKNKALGTRDASNRFGNLPSTGSKQSSHGWKVPNINKDAGVTASNTWGETNVFRALNKQITCTRCHRAHGEKTGYGIQEKFLRKSPKGDYICIQCHAARHWDNMNTRDPLPAADKYYSHPVGVNYSTVAAGKPADFEKIPLNPYPFNPSAELRLYTTFNFDNMGNPVSVKGIKNVICSTCHGPIHASDSNPYTFDSLTTYSKQNQYSSSAGNLLRRYPPGRSNDPKVRSNDLCTSCHKVKRHKNFLCADCHQPHKKENDKNLYLIRTSIYTPYGKKSVYFTSTAHMAKRWGIYSGTASNTSQRSTAICQVCHRNTVNHRAYSTIGAERSHRQIGSEDRFRFCPECHPHNNALGNSSTAFYRSGGCDGCHNFPPADAYGKHSKHTNESVDYTWSSGALVDARTANSYGFSCGRCHNPWAPYTASEYSGGTGRNHYGPSITSYKLYTADIGFGKGKHSLPTNTASATYVYGSNGTNDTGSAGNNYYTWRTPNTSGQGTCSNVYCHGQFFNGATSNNPIWNGSTGSAIQGCGKCHGASSSDLPGKTGGRNFGAHPKHVGNNNAQEQYGYGSPRFRCNACHYLTTTMNNETTHSLDRRYHVDGRANISFDSSAIDGYGFGNGVSKYGGMTYYTSARPTMFVMPRYKTCGLIYCHSDGSRLQGNYSAPFDGGAQNFPLWTTSNATWTSKRCSRCHGNSKFTGITASMPGYDNRADKKNSHEKHIRNGFLCNVCHSKTVGSDNKSIFWNISTRHVNKIWNVDIISRYGGSYNSSTDRCTNVKCHGQRLTSPWGSAGQCQDCHFKSSSEARSDEGYYDGYAFKEFTSTSSVPKVYSSEWANAGHGRAGSSYPSSGNAAAGRVCTNCHKASDNTSHKSAVSGNAYRVYTAASHLDDLCLECHSSSGTNPMQPSTNTKVKGHNSASMGGWGNADWAFTPKCIDCHDPHGDKNRYMLHKYMNYSGSDASGKRTYDRTQEALTQQAGYLSFSTVGAGLINWSSYVKPDYSGICQRCHNTQYVDGVNDMKHFNKSAGPNWDQGYRAEHNSRNRCTNCHKHSEGFKGADCGGCHNFPPVLSGKHAFHVATTVDKSYVGYEIASTRTKYSFGCGKCHNSGDHYQGGFSSYTADVVFDANDSLPRNIGSYAFGARSSFDDGASTTDSFKWAMTKGTCRNLYCHGQFFGGYSGNDPAWYNNGADDPQKCGSCHGAVKNSSGTPTGGAHNRHVSNVGLKCRVCHRDTTGGFDAYTVFDRKLHVNGVTNLWLYTTESRIGSAARYGNAASAFVGITTNTNPAVAPNYRYCANLYCHSMGTDTSNPYNASGSFPAYTAKWGDVRGGYKTGAKCKYCHGSKTGFTGITAAMPNYANGSPKANRHSRHVATYGFACKSCHAGVTVNNTSIDAVGGSALHLNRTYDVKFDKSTRFINNSSGAYTYNAATGGRCTTSYCHSMGADRQFPYNDTATSFMNFTAKWGDNPGTYKAARNVLGKCNYCHGSRAFAGTTGAMPNYASGTPKANSHYKHVVSNALGCNICHYGIARNNTGISDTTRHINGFYNISIAPGYGLNGANQKRYSAVPANNTNGGTCKNITCHGSAGTPKWGSSMGCRNCHFSNAGDTNNYANWSSFKGTAAQLYSSEWGSRGHGSSSTRGTNCDNCHQSAVAHGSATNPYRLYTSNPDTQCGNCHGSGSERNNPALGIMVLPNATGIVSHSRSATGGDAGWNFQNERVKCVDCHDPHGDKNKKMIHALVNYTGSDKYGRPSAPSNWNTLNPGNVVQMTFTTPVGSNWSSFANNSKSGICQRCHSNQADNKMNYMNKEKYTGDHQQHQPCTNCHKHKEGFKGGACDGCHGISGVTFAPPRAPDVTWSDSLTNRSSVHQPHAYNPRSRPGGGNTCVTCHGPDSTGKSETGSHPGNTDYAGMQNLTTAATGRDKRSKLNFGVGIKNPANDTCWNTGCHTPRSYLRTWQKPKDCDDCHGYTKGKGPANRVFNLQTTQSHKTHVNWTGTANLPGSWKKNYNFACSNCHYNWVVNNNYSTHYNAFVNMTAGGPVNRLGQTFYKRGKSFKGYTTGGELSTCSNTYCHGEFTNGTTATTPNWKKGSTTITCTSCHRGKLTGSTMTNGDGYGMPGKHPKHVSDSQGYGFACARCHQRTTLNVTTVYFTYSSHVNSRKDVNFNDQPVDQTGGTYPDGSVSKRCENIYCHSKGADLTTPFTGAAYSIFTAKWGDTLGGYKVAPNQKGKCNYCHGGKSYSGMTSAMPKYSNGTPKANSHDKHVINNGHVCSICHYGVARNNTSISDRTRHVNGFYNISLAAGFRLAAGKTYSMVYNGTGGTCMNNTCHGASKPKWGDPTTASCRKCHLSTNADLDSYGTPGDSKTANIYSSEYVNTGHGRKTAYPYTNSLAANKDCGACHSSNVAHGNSSNPFRLYTANVDSFCKGCHGSSSEISSNSSWNAGGASSATGYQSHRKAGLQAAGFIPSASWNFPDQTARCVDCHDPHGDKNRAMLHKMINYSGSNKYGQPSTYTPTGAVLNYTALGASVQIGWSSYARKIGDAAGLGICQRCHTNEVQMENFNKDYYKGTHREHQECTNCHRHKDSFAPVESTGGQDCDTCHGDLANPMYGQTKSYHHVMSNTSSYIGGTRGYPVGNNLTQNDSRRRCLMCHADHNVFRPELNPGNKGRAGNLRSNIFTRPTTGAAGSSTYQRSDYSPTDPYGGICLSCHTVAQTKNTAKQFDDRSTKTLRLFTSAWRNSPHNYNYTTLKIGKDGSNFKANCLKCHNDTQEKTKWTNSTGFGLHDSKLRRINSVMANTIYEGTAQLGSFTSIRVTGAPWTAGQWKTRTVTLVDGTGKGQSVVIKDNLTNKLGFKTSLTYSAGPGTVFVIGDPPEEDFCYNCHSLTTNLNGARGMDYYNANDYVNKKALKMEQTFNGDNGKATATGTSTTIIDTTKAWVANQWSGYSLKITAGSGSGSDSPVTSNTASVIYVTKLFKKTTTTTSEYVIGNPFRHRIDQFSGLHRSDEALTAPSGLTTFGWYTAAETRVHVGCTDCHNPHAQRKPGAEQGRTSNSSAYTTTTTIVDDGSINGAKNWATNKWKGYIVRAVDRNASGQERMVITNTANTIRVGAPFSARLTGIYYNIVPMGRAEMAAAQPDDQGNMLNGPNNGQWGVRITKWDKPPVSTVGNFDNISSPAFAKITTLVSRKDLVLNLCLKCHSAYAWGTSPNVRPFRIMDGGFRSLGSYTSGVSRDISKAINPNNLAHHAIVSRGNNQPITATGDTLGTASYYNSNWPKYTTGTVSITTAGVASFSTADIFSAKVMTAIPGWFLYAGAAAPAQGVSTGWFQITEITGNNTATVTPLPAAAKTSVAFYLGAGLGNNFVPPYGPWSVIGCADCHDTDGADDPSGPHGSGRNWLLRKMEPQRFKWFNGTNEVTVGWGADSAWTGTYALNVFCLNCHRADIYGNEITQNPGDAGAAPTGTDYVNFSWRGNLSRQTHNPESVGGNNGFAGSYNTFRIACMNCHGGNRSGQIHGTNMGRSYNGNSAIISSAYSYRGKRFLTGGIWEGVKRSTTSAGGECNANTAQAQAGMFASCNQGGDTMSAANYNYDTANDY